VDVRQPESVESTITEIADSHRRLDGLVAAAGIQNVKPAVEFRPHEINDILEVNFHGVYTTAIACARSMIKYEIPGSLLLVASMSGLIANRGFPTSVYNSSKAAVIQLARSLAMEWGKVIKGKPIRVNALCPGNIITPMVLKNFADDPTLKERWENENMLGRLSEPKEYRGAALFALSDASSFMTGSSLVIDGGYTAW
jgi:NAD(P)-dependent dehydrogenase (short-subunit alcohol dehydrogenase family)